MGGGGGGVQAKKKLPWWEYVVFLEQHNCRPLYSPFIPSLPHTQLIILARLPVFRILNDIFLFQSVVNATAACREVKTSPKFSKFLELVLLMGNYMNAGSRNEGSMGFEMNYLTKVSIQSTAFDSENDYWSGCRNVSHCL